MCDYDMMVEQRGTILLYQDKDYGGERSEPRTSVCFY